MVVMVTNPAGFRLGLRLLGIISLHVKLPSSLNLLGCRPNPNSSYRAVLLNSMIVSFYQSVAQQCIESHTRPDFLIGTVYKYNV